MPVPDFQTIMLPLLRFAADGIEHSMTDAREALAKEFALTPEERAELLPSGRVRRFDNRVAWAKVYLTRAGLLTSERRAHFSVAPRGREVLAKSPARIDISFLEQFPEFREFRTRATTDGETAPALPPGVTESPETPEESLERAYTSIQNELILEVLARVKTASPSFFESLVVELLLKMGYGRRLAEAGRVVGGVGDEGIDGVIISNNPTHARTRQPQHVRDSGHVVLTRVDRIAYAGVAALVLL
jgi:restriction system protein